MEVTSLLCIGVFLLASPPFSLSPPPRPLTHLLLLLGSVHKLKLARLLIDLILELLVRS